MAAIVDGSGDQQSTLGVDAGGGDEPPCQPNNDGGPKNPCAAGDLLPNGDDDLVIHHDSNHVDEADNGRDHAPHQVPAEGSRWQTTLNDVSQYLAGLNPASSGSYSPGYDGVDSERLVWLLFCFLDNEENRDRFTKFLEADSKPDGWFCMGHICSIGHDDNETVGPGCAFHQQHDYCRLQVRHLDASSGGRTLDFRVEIRDGDDHDEVKDEVDDLHWAMGTRG